MEAVGGAERAIFNKTIRVRDQAIMVTELMVGEMGGPRFTKVWMEFRVTSVTVIYPWLTASHQIPIQHFKFKWRTPSVTDDKRVVSSSADRADIVLEFGTCISVGLTFRSKMFHNPHYNAASYPVCA
jgi:hypothetical protein